MRRAIAHDKVDGFAFVHGELAHRRHVLADERSSRAEHDQIRANDRFDSILNTGDPRGRGSVIEAQREIHSDRRCPANALHHAHQVGIVDTDRHKIDQRKSKRIALECGFQDQRIVPVPAGGLAPLHSGRDAPKAVIFFAQKASEAGIGRKIGQTKPVDGAIQAHQRGGFAVSNEGVAFNRAT